MSRYATEGRRTLASTNTSAAAVSATATAIGSLRVEVVERLFVEAVKVGDLNDIDRSVTGFKLGIHGRLTAP
jgi:hypothetical protein